MKISDHIKASVSILEAARYYVEMKHLGHGVSVGLCPFHTEKTPSFHVSNREGWYRCHGCSSRGDVISLVQKLEACGFQEAIEILAERHRATLPEKVRKSPIKRRIVELERQGKIREALELTDQLKGKK